MSAVLSELIQTQLKAAFPEADSFYNNKAFADAIATAIQLYLTNPAYVQTIPLPTGPGNGPITHIHPNIPHSLSAG